jgi:thiamine-monophosphate kinase
VPWNEDSLHRWLARRPRARALAGSAMHDAAVLRGLRGRPVLCTDSVVEGVHFGLGTPPRKVGAKAVGRVLSDLAAAAARPVGVLLALRASPDAAERELRALISGAARAVEAAGGELLGGDLTAAPGPLQATVTGLGEADAKRRPVGRDRARAGQRVLLTGPVGGSALGRHLAIRPRLDEGRWLASLGATVLMDVSDGLALDLARVARASGVRIDLEHVPVHRDARRLGRNSGRAPRDHALGDGEDHELIACLPAAAAERALAAAPRRCPGLVLVGRVRRGSGLWIADESGALERAVRPAGWVHGG